MKIFRIVLLALVFVSSNSVADEYLIDTKGMHASIQFKIAHLGYSLLWGRFNDFDGHLVLTRVVPKHQKLK